MDKQPFASFQGALAIVTGGGGGIGRALCVGLVEAGCSLAFCDLSSQSAEETRVMCEAAKVAGAVVTTHRIDVSNEQEVLDFADQVAQSHTAQNRKILVVNNAGIASNESISGNRAAWDRVFNVNWGGVYFMTRAFMPMLLESKHGYLVNVSSINGIWASLSPFALSSAYAASKFAVKGFTEALISDLRLTAPHVRVAVVMPGNIKTGIASNLTREISPARLQLERERAGMRVRAMERLRGTAEYDKLKEDMEFQLKKNDDLNGNMTCT